ncbi:hypothetical protein ABPG75_003239 [Micractinium tetrahymenae]
MRLATRRALCVLLAAAIAGDAVAVTRVAILSDTHLTGPEYPLNTENGAIDNASISKTSESMYRAIQNLNAVTPRPELVLFGGDVVHNGLDYVSQLGLNQTGLRKLYRDPVNAYKIAAGLFAKLQYPKLFTWGNHDNRVTCGNPGSSAPKPLAAEISRHFFNAEPYASVRVGKWHIVALNSMYGYTWDPTDPRCSTSLSSYGEEQLKWLDKTLQDGRPTLVMMHFLPTTSVRNEVNTTKSYRDLASVLTAHAANVKLVLSGHLHKGTDWEDLYPFATRTVPSIRYNPMNFLVLDLFDNGTFSFIDAAKNRGGGRCSDYWTYNGAPQYAAAYEGRDQGECGYPAAGAEATWPLDPVLQPSGIPSSDAFNPERSCQAVLARNFLDACPSGASQDCCDVLADQFRASSSAPFATCLCQPSLYTAAAEYLQTKYGQDLKQVLDTCSTQFRKAMFYRGGPTWCPAPPA